jgi:putative flippase GtrA
MKAGLILFGEYHVRPFLRFVAVGGLATIVYFVSLSLQIEFARVDYRVAISIAYAFSVAVNFFANKLFTFQGEQLLAPVGQAFRYAVLVVLNYIITLGITALVVECLGFAAYIGVALSIPVTLVTGYLVSQFWIFKSRKTTNVQ